MNDNIDTLLGEFITSDASRRARITETVSDSPDQRIHSLILKTLADKLEEDFVRVTILKEVPFQGYTFDVRKRFIALCLSN